MSLKKFSSLLSGFLLLVVFITSGFSLCLVHYSSDHHHQAPAHIALEAQLQQNCCAAETKFKESAEPIVVATNSTTNKIHPITLAIISLVQPVAYIPEFFRPPDISHNQLLHSQSSLMVFRC